jgi:peptide/nickel transport system substrate-binding protein
MRRRDLLKAGIGAAAALAAPRVGGAAAAKTLVIAPTADLVVLDPVVTFNRQTRNYAYLVFDTLYGRSIRAGRRSPRWWRGMRSTMTG